MNSLSLNMPISIGEKGSGIVQVAVRIFRYFKLNVHAK